jgi:hypothetical protein
MATVKEGFVRETDGSSVSLIVPSGKTVAVYGRPLLTIFE